MNSRPSRLLSGGSTPELQRLNQSAVAGRKMSGRRGSNSPPIAWKAIALPNELLPLLNNVLIS